MSSIEKTKPHFLFFITKNNVISYWEKKEFRLKHTSVCWESFYIFSFKNTAHLKMVVIKTYLGYVCPHFNLASLLWCTIQSKISPPVPLLNCSNSWYVPFVSEAKENVPFTHICMSKLCTHWDKHTKTQSPYTQCITHTVLCVYANSNNFCAVVWKMHLTTVYLPMYLPLVCATRDSDTVRYIKKQTAYLILLSPPERKWMSHHCDCLPFTASNIISDVYMLFGVAFSFLHFENVLNCTGLWFS